MEMNMKIMKPGKMILLLINNRTVTLGSTVYQINSITRIEKYKIKPIADRKFSALNPQGVQNGVR
jgi:hypothetical protein